MKWFCHQSFFEKHGKATQSSSRYPKAHLHKKSPTNISIRSCLIACLLAYLLTYLLASLLTCLLTYVLAYLFTGLLAYLLAYLLTRLLAYSLAYLPPALEPTVQNYPDPPYFRTDGLKPP